MRHPSSCQSATISRSPGCAGNAETPRALRLANGRCAATRGSQTRLLIRRWVVKCLLGGAVVGRVVVALRAGARAYFGPRPPVLAVCGPATRCLMGESVGINRHGAGDERALRRRSSQSRWPRVMRWRPARAQRSVDRGRAGGAIEPRNNIISGCRRCPHGGRRNRWRRYWRVAGGPCAVREPRHVRQAPCTRTERSRGRPLVVGDAPSWMVRGVADRRRLGREGNA